MQIVILFKIENEVHMKDSIILPLNYEKVFMMEARKSGLIKHKEIHNAPNFSYFDNHEYELYKRCSKAKQNLFQMILLYDELIIRDSDPTFEYNEIQNMGNFKIYIYWMIFIITMQVNKKIMHYMQSI